MDWIFYQLQVSGKKIRVPVREMRTTDTMEVHIVGNVIVKGQEEEKNEGIHCI